MYDDMPFDTDRHLMLLADAGLMGLYAADCGAVAKMAAVLDRRFPLGTARGAGRWSAGISD